jgi:hypothetical protein
VYQIDNWQTDLSRSARAFVQKVWPILKQRIGGELIPVETNTSSELFRLLDQRAGIDEWHWGGDKGIRGMASRVQWIKPGYAPWNTFTMRKSRDSGAKTEYQKRVEAIQSNEGWMYPALTVQAYIRDNENAELLSFGLAYTDEIIDYILKGLADDNATTNASFYIIPFCPVAIYAWPDKLNLSLVHRSHQERQPIRTIAGLNEQIAELSAECAAKDIEIGRLLLYNRVQAEALHTLESRVKKKNGHSPPGAAIQMELPGVAAPGSPEDKTETNEG